MANAGADESVSEQVELSPAWLRQIVAQTPALVGAFRGPAHALAYANPAFLDHLGRVEADIAGSSVWQLLPALETQGWVESWDRVYRTGEPFAGAATLGRQGGGGAPGAAGWKLSLAPLRGATGRIEGVHMHATAVGVGTTDSAGSEQAALLARLVSAEEDERHRLARELHDDMGQHLAALVVGLRALADRTTDPVAVDRLRRLRALASTMGEAAHRLAAELRPAALDGLGLGGALAQYADEWSAHANVLVDLHLRGLDEARLPRTVETTIYRIVQEALTNVLRHARATRVSVIVERRSGHVLTIVEDDGRGFDVDRVTGAPDAGPRLGLLGMRERAALVRGVLTIEAVPGYGTTVFARIPLALRDDPALGAPDAAARR